MSWCISRAGAWPGALSNVVKSGLGACIPKLRPTITCGAITDYPAAKQSRLGINNTGSSIRIRSSSSSSDRKDCGRSLKSTARGAGWSNDALGEAIKKESLDGVALHWINTINTAIYMAAAMGDVAVSEDATRPDSGGMSIPGAQQEVMKRAADPSVVYSISSTLSKPINTKFDFFVVCGALDDIVCHLPLDTLRLYRPALETLASADSAPSPEGVSVPSLADRARDAIKFINNPDLAWAPQHKNDYMADRSLSERVHTAEQMKPFVEELLGWLADLNWPPYLTCEKQLARFPELTIDPIKKIILENRNDPEWLFHLLVFVEQNVPLGTWEKIEPELIQLANIEAEDEESIDLREASQRMLRLLNESGETVAS
ncbi:hypothetical protein GGI43DRAFT_271112 [Trichoderma evansii]